MTGKLERFTPHARRALRLAQDAAVRLNHSEIDAEHLLLGLVSAEQGAAVQVLHTLGVAPGQVIRAVERTVAQGERLVMEERVLTPRIKRVIEVAAAAARKMEHPAIGTEHLLLGLVLEQKGVAVRVLEALGIEGAHVGREIQKMWVTKKPGKVAQGKKGSTR
jgi:ATP-dependent Clp protease ATP-binding subunit ClpC